MPDTLYPYGFSSATIQQFGRFAVVGLLNTGIDFILFTVLYHSVGLALIPANSIGYCAGTLNGFFMNKYWTFSESGRHGHSRSQLPLFFLLYLIGLGLSNIIVWFLIPVMPALLAKVWATAVALIWNFWSSRRFVYRASPGI